MIEFNQAALHTELLDRKQKLQTAIKTVGQTDNLATLLKEVDLALEKIARGTFGLCETCHDSIERDRLLADPLVRNCLDHLTTAERRLLERDLDLAYQVQRNLLPKSGVKIAGWETAFHYEPAGSVSGDYCDLIMSEGDGSAFHFFLGDVSGKGIAASILMAHLHAMFRSLVKLSQPVGELLEQANRLFSEDTMARYFATLVAGKADSSGGIEIANAGHCVPLLVHKGSVTTIPTTGFPLGLFHASEYHSKQLTLSVGETLVLYSDGVTEARDGSDHFYGEQRLIEAVRENLERPPHEFIHACLDDLNRFRSSAAKADDVTLMVLRRT
ncbi:MAG: SpoIIE family protein phosphatase [Bacteroidota bacterium]